LEVNAHEARFILPHGLPNRDSVADQVAIVHRRRRFVRLLAAFVSWNGI